MSINSEESTCQSLLSHITPTLASFAEEIESELFSRTDTPLQLSIPFSALSLLTAYVSSMKPKALISETTADTRNIGIILNGWNEFLQKNEQWHIISNPLTEQEIQGDVYTNLSAAYHAALFYKDTHHHLYISDTALEDVLPDPAEYMNSCVSLTTGEPISITDFVTMCVDSGYTRYQASLEEGGIRVRGEDIDISHPIIDGYFTITLFGNSIEKIVHTVGQRSSVISSLRLPPMKFPETTSSWSSFLTNYLVLRPSHLSSIHGAQTIITDAPKADIESPFINEDTQELNTAKPMYVLYRNRQRVEEYVREHYVSTFLLCSSSLADTPVSLLTADWQLISEAHLFPPERELSHSPITYERALELIASLQEGKPAVHADHGIGMYEGLQRRVIDSYEKEYLVLRYAEGDVLSVPVELAYKVTPYIGDSQPSIHRLGGTLWSKTRKAALHDAIAFAKELLEISRKRLLANRSSYALQSTTDETLDASFPFELTPDQERTWQEVRSDLQQEHPMDRLVVGDVGFGKTEIAMRAAFHVASSGKQVAILAPTTLLVQQHFDTFTARFPQLASNIFLLSRFVSTKDQRLAREAIAADEAKIVVGTHALLSNLTTWKNLGLVIIDEEQRFGVRQKEHFKKIRAAVDVLSLSATPIPRTLSMALSGLRSLSLIATPPVGRKSIKTYVRKIEPELVKNVLNRELGRGGQVYVVAPKIRQLGAIKEEITSLIPEARIAVAHAQLPDTTLSKIIHDFDAGNIDILISSSIVENGLDLPNANTMIVWYAASFGLAELYQLRGRVGRRDRQGYAYFLYRHERLTDQQRERLTALTEASRLGSGWEIARRDLEMRGAGNLLGADQSGSVNSVGVGLYLDMVHQAVETIDESQTTPLETQIELPLSSIIPISYIRDAHERTRWYVRLTRAKAEQLPQYMLDLENTYGPLPQETQNLFHILELQRAASKITITRIATSVVSPPDEDPYARLEIEANNIPQVLKQLGDLGNWVVRSNKLTWDVDAITPSLITQITQACKQA